MHTSQRVSALALAVAIALQSLPRESAAQAYPNKPIHMIVPLAAASAVDNAARIITTKMGANMGQQIVIENQPGAAGLIGTERVACAGTPRDIVSRLNAEIVKAMNEPEQRGLLIAQGLTPRGSTPAELGVATREQLAKYQRLIRAANIRAE